MDHARAARAAVGRWHAPRPVPRLAAMRLVLRPPHSRSTASGKRAAKASPRSLALCRFSMRTASFISLGSAIQSRSHCSRPLLSPVARYHRRAKVPNGRGSHGAGLRAVASSNQTTWEHAGQRPTGAPIPVHHCPFIPSDHSGTSSWKYKEIGTMRVKYPAQAGHR